MRLIEVIPSATKTKRFTAIFTDDTSTKRVHFGLKDPKVGTFIDHGDKKLKEAYHSRHKKDLSTNDPLRAGYLSYYLLWNKPTLKGSIKDYKKRFNL